MLDPFVPREEKTADNNSTGLWSIQTWERTQKD